MEIVKKFSYAFILFTFLIAIISCEKKENKEETIKLQEPTKIDTSSKLNKITISINYGPPESDIVLNTDWKIRVDLFKKISPDIEVKVEQWVYQPDIFQSKLIGGTLTDLVQTFATEGETMISNSAIEDLNSEYENWSEFSNFRKEILTPFERDGKYYAFPIYGYSMAIFYNKAIFKKAGLVDTNGEPIPPNTWEDFIKCCIKIKETCPGTAGFGILAGDVKMAGWHFLNWGWQAGGEYIKKIDGKWRAVFNSSEIKKALEFLYDLRWKYNVLQSNLLADYDEILELFASERIAMAIEPANEGSIIALKDKLGFDLNKLGIALLPEGPGGRFIQMGADYYVFKKGISPEKKKVCFQWATFLVSPEFREAKLKVFSEKGWIVGAPEVPIFKGETQKRIDEIIEKYRNVPRYADYQENVINYLRAEPPYFCQQLYGEVLGPLVQEVLTKKDTNISAVLKEKTDMFQKRFLNRLN